MLTIAVDAMGGDHFPKPEVEGALQAVRSQDVKVILVGKEEVVTKELDRQGNWRQLPIEVHHASEVITMEEGVRAIREKKDSSMRVAARLVRDGAAQGMVSAGNTGAVMATAKMVQGLAHGVDRPALASAFPTLSGRPAVMIDVGANVDCSATMLAQFAVMGDIYSRIIFHTESPKVGLLSIGEEEHKGNALTHDAMEVLKTLKHIQFIGNVEGRDIYTGKVDVVVCDGFVGNVALKTSEGLVDVIGKMLREYLSQTPMRKLGALLAQGAFRAFRKRVDYSEYGGAPLLGLKGVCIICHGRSNANAIKNAVRVAAEFAANKISDQIASELTDWASGQAG
jgi:glycerol-3-phosphate acyltransferase PlsX